MRVSTDQMTTIVNTTPQKYLQEKKPQKSQLYFHIILKMNGENIKNRVRALLKKYVTGYVKATGGDVMEINAAHDRLHILVGLEQTCALADFISELKLVSKTFARRRLSAKDFVWCEEYEAFTISLSQVDRVKSYIRRQSRFEIQESYASSWQPVKRAEFY